MFDVPTARLIASAPALDGLDLEGLSKELTKAYSTIVSLRMRLRRTSSDAVTPNELDEILSMLERSDSLRRHLPLSHRTVRIELPLHLSRRLHISFGLRRNSCWELVRILRRWRLSPSARSWLPLSCS
jgi:hypothetical protein